MSVSDKLGRAAASLGDPASVYADSSAGARSRKNLAVEGFLALRRRVAEEGPAALDGFYQAAAALTRPNLPAWREVWENGPLAAARRTGGQLTALDRGDHSHLREGRLTVLPPPGERKFGMCGRLETYEQARLAR